MKDLKHLIYFENLLQEANNDLVKQATNNGKLAIAGDTIPEGAVMVGKIMRKRQIGSTLVTGIRTYGYARMMYTVKVETLA